MAFVDIIKPKSPMGVENRLRPYKRGEAEITSDVCYEVLQATNFGRSLRDMLDCMAKLPDEVLSGEKFKTILIAVMAGREQPDNVVERVRKLAERGGYADAVPSEPVLIPTGYGEEALQSHFERRMVLHLDDGAVNAADLSGYAKLVLPETTDGTFAFMSCRNFPKDIDATAVSKKVDFHDCAVDTLCGFKTAKATAVCFSGKEGTADGDYTKCADVSFYHVDFRPCMAPKFGEGSNVSITECHLHPQTDVTRAGKVEILGVDGKDLAGLVFGDGAEVCLSPGVDGDRLPRLDFSSLKALQLYCWDMQDYRSLPLKGGATADFANLSNVPADFDSSRLDEVALDRVKFTELPSLRFKNGAKAKICCTELAGTTDLTLCSEVRLEVSSPGDLHCFEYGRVEELVLWDAANFGTKENFAGCKRVEFKHCNVKNDCYGRFDEDASVCFYGGELKGIFDCGKCAEVYVSNGDAMKIKTAPGVKIRGHFFDQTFYGTEMFKRFDEVSVEDSKFDDFWEELVFKDGADVTMRNVTLPEKVDMSGCVAAQCNDCIWKYVRQVQFPDEPTYLRYKDELPAEAHAVWGKVPAAVLLRNKARG